MKKFICILIVITTLCFSVSPMIIFAAEVFDNIDTVTNATTFSCIYDKDTGSISISGTMSYDVIIKYKNYSLVVYRILPGQNVADIITDTEILPVAKSDISIKFQFSIDVNNIEDKISRYALFLLSPENKLILADSPQYVEVQGDNSDKSTYDGYKGVITDNIGNSVPNTVIIPVYLDAVVSNIPKGYLYQSGFSRFYFDQVYIDEIDAKINSALNCGGKVYLQYLLRPEGIKYGFSDTDISDADYLMPNVYSDQTLILLDSFTSFISDRYSEATGKLSGIILGKNIDLAEYYNACGITSLEEYADAYSIYLATVSIASRIVIPDIDIIIPFSSTYSFAEEHAGVFYSVDILEYLLNYFDDSFSTPISFRTLVECEYAPADIIYDAKNEVSIQPVYSSDILNVNNLNVYSNALRKLDARYKSISPEFIYVWKIDENLKGSELEFLYAYSYYKLLKQTNLMSFVASFEANPNFDDIKNTVKEIDGNKAFDVANRILKNLGLAS